MIEQFRDPIFWELFWNNGGRFLLTLIVMIYSLLIGIMIYGHTKDRRNRSKVSKSNKKWINQTTKRRRLFDGMETLETYPQRFSARPHMQGARHVSTHQGIPVNDRHEPIRSDRVIVHSEGLVQPVQLSEGELSQPAVSQESLSYPPTEVFVK